MSLEKSLKKQLSEIKTKKSMLISESKYVQTRVEKLFEDIDLKNDKHLIILRSELIKEFKVLKQNDLLNEESSALIDNIGYMLGKIGKATWDRMFIGFYKQIAKSMGFDTDTFMFNVIVEGFQLLEWSDIVKVLGGDCDLLVKKLTVALMSGLSKKIADKMDMGGPGYDIIRMALMQGLADDPDSPIGKLIQQNMSPIVCKKMDEWLGKVEKKGDVLKKEMGEPKKSEPSPTSTPSSPSVLGQVKSAMGL